MQPLTLTLKGFSGIRDGLGREEIILDLERLAVGAQLIAIAGANGRGKTTIMDNLHPFPVMPSRAGADGLGSFSYYDHVYLPESVKDLEWEHGGRRYRSQLVIRANGKKKTEAFLHIRNGQGWEPVRLADGTLSDGKAETYLRCVEAILGSAQTFFTSVFSAQGRRALALYKNAEIKTLLADLLGLEEIRAIGAKAAETAKLLRLGLAGIRQELTALQDEAKQIARQRSVLGDTAGKVDAAERTKAQAQATLDAAKQVVARLAALKELGTQTEARRSQLNAERKALIESGKAALTALDEQDRREAARLAQLDRQIAQRMEAARVKRETLEQQRSKLQAVLKRAPAIALAKRHVATANLIVAQREQRLAAARSQVERFDALVAGEKLAAQRLAAIEREAGQAVLKAQDLARRFGLTAQVPCAGTDLQGQCKLLGDAREAQTLMPSAQAHIARLDAEKAEVTEQLKRLRAELSDLGEARSHLSRAEAKLARAHERESKLELILARQGELDQATEALARVEAELYELNKHAERGGEGEAERAERATITQAREDIVARREAQARQTRESLERIDQALGALPAAFDASQLQDANKAVERAQRACEEADKGFVQALRDQQAAAEADKRAEAIEKRNKQTESRARQVEQQLGTWSLFAKCMSNDGVIALAIDDAGPVLSGLANDLLLACYGPRFTVSIKTLVETAKGEAREGFDIVVHDADSGDAKSVTLMSGGEKTWVNEALTRAIALYLAQNAGRRYQTLFADESDGSLDPERKRMFMAMKREVLRLGGYAREFFVSQTPELTAMADAVIDLDSMAVAAGMIA